MAKIRSSLSKLKTRQKRNNLTKKQQKSSDNEQREAGVDVVDAKLSRKILRLARKQHEEEEQGYRSSDDYEAQDEIPSLGEDRLVPNDNIYTSALRRYRSSSEDDISSAVEEYEADDEFGPENIEDMDPEEQHLYQKFLPSVDGEERVNLTDKILAKIKEVEEQGDCHVATAVDARDRMTKFIGLSPKIIEVYTKIGQLLSRYKSGRLPKVFKIIPSLPNWDQILVLTEPEKWTPNACYEATKLFVSNLNAQCCRKFLTHVLLERVRDDIAEHRKLNYHHYQALIKAMYKPAAWFKGILFPLCSSTTCTLKEAVILGSVLKKSAVPVLHSSAALLHLAEMEYTGPTSIFVKVLIDKKYALPYKVVDALVDHFLRLFNQHEELPVLFHQSMLAFAQRYKNEISEDQRSALVSANKLRGHHLIGPEVNRELTSNVEQRQISGIADTVMVN